MSNHITASALVNLQHCDLKRGQNSVLNDFYFQLFDGQHTAILGPNGSGKSSLIKLITRELYPVDKPSCRCELFGHSRIHVDKLRKDIGLVSEDLQHNYRALASGLEVVISGFFGSIGLFEHQCISVAMRDEAQSLMYDLGIDSLRDLPYLSLSTGQQRRLLLARALVNKPKLLILDEPTNGLDLPSALQFVALLRQIAQQKLSHCGTTILLVTHHLQEIIPEISKALLIKSGRNIAFGDVATTLTAAALSDLYDMSLTLHCHKGFYSALPA